ncbi:MAG: hypothetical protein Q8S12_09705 [Hydrogenophaga sp.]|nr:hypothetical protein [Hydrogenophaga sp.]MDP3626864.1 hypothetical protein [Hydrogenophaga sp.]
MIDLSYPLAVLASRMPWQENEARVAQFFSRQGLVLLSPTGSLK